MKRAIKKIGMLLAAPLALAGCITSPTPITASCDVGWKNKQVLLTGVNACDESIATGSFKVSKDRFTLEGWEAYRPRGNQAQEVDFNLSYDVPLETMGERIGSETLQATAKHLGLCLYDGNYMFPDQNFGDIHHLQETFYSKSLPLDLRLKFAQYLGPGSRHGNFVALEAGKSFQLNDRLSLSVGARADYQTDVCAQGNGFTHVQETIGLCTQLNDKLELNLGAMFQQPIQNRFDGAGPDYETVWGANLTCTF